MMDTLYHRRTIGGQVIPKSQAGVYGYFIRELQGANARLVRLVRESVSMDSAEPEAAVLQAKTEAERNVCAVAKRLAAERGNPLHYGDNLPGMFDAEGNALTPRRFSFSDLVCYGPAGEGGLSEFLELCKMPDGTTGEHLDLAAGLLSLDEALKFAAADLAYAFHLLEDGKRHAEYVEIDRARRRLRAQVPQEVIDQAFRELQSARSRKRYALDKSGKQAVKGEVKDCWQRWQAEPSRYQTLAAFAADMLAKYPDHLTNPQVVERWTRAWRAAEVVRN